MPQTNPALSNNAYKAARVLMQQGIPFTIVNQHGETKHFTPGSCIYNVKDLKYFLELCYELEDHITVRVAP